MRWILMLITAALVIITLVISLFVFISIYDFNRLKSVIVLIVKDKTGLDMTIDGDLGFQAGSTLIVSARDISIKNMSWGSRPELAKIGHFELQVALLQLFLGKIVVNRLIIEEPDILMETDKTGALNIGFTSGKNQTPSASHKWLRNKLSGMIFITKLQLRKAVFTYKDGMSGKTHRVRLDNMATTTINSEDPFELCINGDVNNTPFEMNGIFGTLSSLCNPETIWPVEINARTADATCRINGSIMDIIKLNGVSFSATATGKSIAAVAVPAGFTALPDIGPFNISLYIDDQDGAMAIDNLDISIGSEDLVEIKITGNIAEVLTLQGLDVNFAVKGDDITRIEKLTGRAMPVSGPFSANGRFLNTAKNIYMCNNLMVALRKNRISGSVGLNMAGNIPQVTVDLSTEQCDVRSLLKPDIAGQTWARNLPVTDRIRLTAAIDDITDAFSVKSLELFIRTENLLEVEINGVIRDPLALRGIELDVAVRGNDTADISSLIGQTFSIREPFDISWHVTNRETGIYGIKNLNAFMGENDLGGEIELDLTLQKPGLKADIHSRKFDLRTFLPKDDKNNNGVLETSLPAGKKREKLFSEKPLPFEKLFFIDADVRLHIGELLLPGIALDDLIVHTILKDGHIIVVIPEGTIGGGATNGRFELLQHEGETEIAVMVKIADGELGTMLAELGITKYFEGTFSADIEVNGRGESLNALMAGLCGRTMIVMSNGRINNRYIDIIGGDLTAQILRLINPFSKKEDYSELNCLVKHLDIKDGIASCKALVIDTEKTTVIGGGTVYLDTEKLKLIFNLSPKKGIGIKGIGRISVGLGRLANAFKISGTLSSPSVVINPKGAIIKVGKAIVGMSIFGPFSIATNFIHVKRDRNDPCLAAIEAAEKGVTVSDEEDVPKKKRCWLKRLFGK